MLRGLTRCFGAFCFFHADKAVVPHAAYGRAGINARYAGQGLGGGALSDTGGVLGGWFKGGSRHGCSPILVALHNDGAMHIQYPLKVNMWLK